MTALQGHANILPAHHTPSTCRARPSHHARSVCACVQPPWIGSIIRVCTSPLPDARLPFSRLHDWLFTGGLSLAYVSSRCVERKPTNEPCVTVRGVGGIHVVVTHTSNSHRKSTQCVLVSIETTLQGVSPAPSHPWALASSQVCLCVGTAGRTIHLGVDRGWGSHTSARGVCQCA